MSIEKICSEIAAKIPLLKQKGYEEGFAAGQASGGGGDMSAWWKAFFTSQKELAQIGTFGSAGWNEQTFKPDRTVDAESIGTSNANTLFARSGFEVFPEFLSDGVTPVLDTTGFNTMGSIFGNCSKLKRIEAVLDLKMCTNMTTAFAGSSTKPCPLESVKLKNVQKVTIWTSAFNYCHSLTDIGQEDGEDFSDFGYFSASVDLSKTAIDFGTPKMSLCNFSRDSRQENSYLKFYYGDNAPTLTINRQQYDAAQAYLDLDYSSEDFGPYFEQNMVGGCGWMLAVVEGG